MIFLTLVACFVIVKGNEIVLEPHHPQPYKFGYSIKDKGGVQHREEAGNGAGVVEGSYGIVDNKGLLRQVNYVADHGGFRAAIKTNEPGTAGQNPAAVKMMSNDPYAQGGRVPYNSRVNDPYVPALEISDPVYGFPTLYGYKAPYMPYAPALYQNHPFGYNGHAHLGYNNGLMLRPDLAYQGYGLGYGQYGNGYQGGLAYSNLLGAGYMNQGGVVSYGANLIGGKIRGYDSRFSNEP